MVSRRITIIDGHPDPDQVHFVHALADAYERGARDFQSGKPGAAVRRCQTDLAWAQHWVIFYPLWLGSMPAMLKGFFEQVARPGFAFSAARGGERARRLLAGRSAHVFVTMGMPAFFYRWYYRSHSLKSLERNILAFIGVAPVRLSIVGMVEGVSAAVRKKWLQRARALGARAA